jgi:hypothetical protein
MRATASQSILRLLLIFIALTLACGILSNRPSSEVSYRYDSLPEAGDEDRTVAEYRAISQWGKFNMSFHFVNGTDRLSDERERDLVRAAFQLWADQTPLRFDEVADPAQADILVGWASGEHGDGDPFDGPGDVLAHASYPNPYSDRQVILHFDNDERWVDSTSQNVDLLTVAAHEIGHNLGLDHSNDPNSLMFPSYSGPHRFLSADDIAGVQSLYGLASEPGAGPEVPPQNATPPPSANQDADQDGISDQDEILRTGTDPNNPDSDGDKISDGIEVLYRMNPLDADMDRDGVNDGDEVAQGTNPFFPDQAADVSPELSRDVNEFLTRAIELQISAYRNGDPTIAASIMSGAVFDTLTSDIASLNEKGLAQLSEIDYYRSYIHEIRVANDTLIEVDTCEVWTTATYRRSDGAFLQSNGPALLPQTITIQNTGQGWFITQVEFFEAPAFCQN